DTIGEMTTALSVLERFTGKALALQTTGAITKYTDEELRTLGADLLKNSPGRADELEVFADGWENGDRKVRLIKVAPAWRLFRELIAYHAATQLVVFIQSGQIETYEDLLEALPAGTPLNNWINAGGQLIREAELKSLIANIHAGKVRTWDNVHEWYIRQGQQY